MSDDWVKKMFGMHDGGVYKGPFLRPSEEPVLLSGPTVTGRFSGKRPDFKELPKGSGATVIIKSQQVGKSEELARRAGLAEVDYSAVERRIMAQMAAAFALPEKMLRHARQPPPDAAADQWRKLFDIMIVRLIDKELAYLLAYRGFEAVQRRIDEEGCGAVFAAAKEWPEDDE